jgi:hypothetical protein
MPEMHGISRLQERHPARRTAGFASHNAAFISLAPAHALHTK